MNETAVAYDNGSGRVPTAYLSTATGYPTGNGYVYPTQTYLRGAPFAPYLSSTPPYYSGTMANATSYSPLDYPSAAAYAQGSHYYGSRAGSAAYYSTVSSVSSANIYPSSLSAGALTENNLGTSFAVKCENKRGKSSKKKKTGATGSNQSTESGFNRVLIWEMDDVCIASNCFLQMACSKDKMFGQHMINCWQRFVERMMVNGFRVDHSEECDQSHVEDAAIEETNTIQETRPDGEQFDESNAPVLVQPMARGGVDWMRRVAARFVHVRDTYTRFKNDPSGLVQLGVLQNGDELDTARQKLESLGEGWPDKVERCLQLVVAKSGSEHCTNVLLSNEPLVPTLAKLLLTRQAIAFPIDNVYSSNKTGKEACLERVKNKYGKKCTFLMITSNPQTAEVARREEIPVWLLANIDALRNLLFALQHHILG